MSIVVKLVTYKESCGDNYIVVLENDRDPKARIWDNDGRITPFSSRNIVHARHEAKAWAKFLKVESIIDHTGIPEVEGEDVMAYDVKGVGSTIRVDEISKLFSEALEEASCKERNSCDGCNAGMQIKPNTKLHVNPKTGFTHMSCTKDRYVGE